MSVLDIARQVSGFRRPENDPYTCLSCDGSFEVQYHSCPVCGGYDLRRTKWVE